MGERGAAGGLAGSTGGDGGLSSVAGPGDSWRPLVFLASKKGNTLPFPSLPVDAASAQGSIAAAVSAASGQRRGVSPPWAGSRPPPSGSPP